MSFDWLVKGGLVMLPLIGFSVITLAVIIERALKLHSGQVLSPSIIQALEEGKSTQDIEFLLKTDDSILSHFLKRISKKSNETKEVLEQLAHSYFKKTWNDLEKHLEVLNIVATTSPLLGLLGTVIGMVSIFQGLAETGSGGNSLILSRGISEALITTITGLIIAVPALIGYAYFSKRVEQYLLVFEECAKLYIAQLKGLTNAKELRTENQYVD